MDKPSESSNTIVDKEPNENQEKSSASMTPEKESDTQNYQIAPHTDDPVSESNHQEENTLSITPTEESNTSQQTPIAPDESAVKPDQENSILRPEKVLDKLPLRRNAENISNSSNSNQGISFSKLPEKPTGDGYNWRKYGQKLVKGNTFVRSYYKCTSVNCPARKQVERSHEGHIMEINYLWKHEHPKPHQLQKGSSVFVQSKGQDDPSVTTSEDHSSVHPEVSETETRQLAVVPVSMEVAASQTNEIKSDNNTPDVLSDSKRQKIENSSVNEGVSTKTTCEQRVVVQIASVVDIVNDGYRWRKYGQKLVKGNHNPRSYYRCSSAGCPAKKHVERASHDEKVVITTYEARHDHDMPAGGRATITQNIVGPGGTGTGTGTTSMDGTRSSEPEGARESSGMEMVVHVSAT